MNPELKPLKDQTIVITGASSGIGLTTARMAADRGASVVLAARSEDALERVTAEIRGEGGSAAYVVADVRDRNDVRRIARVATEEFDGFDTWVNAAAAFIYGELRDVPVGDMRRLFDVNVWGLLYGSLEAADHLEAEGGAIINLGSVLSDRALLYQGSYSASKHAVKGFTDALRMELERDDVPVSVTLVKPSAIDTPYPKHAKNYMGRESALPPPVYAPETVAKTILHCAEHPKRDVFVGGGAKGVATLGRLAPGITDAVMRRLFSRAQQKSRLAGPISDNTLDRPADESEERGDHDGHVAESSLYTWASLHPLRAAGMAAGAGLIAGVAWLARRRSKRRRGERTESQNERRTHSDRSRERSERSPKHIGRPPKS